MSLPEVHLVGGTGAEAVKLAPVVVALRAAGLLRPVLVAAGSQAAAVTQALAAFDLTADVTLPAAPLTELMTRLNEFWATRTPAAVLVQGDSFTSLAAALTASWRCVPVAHLSAGQRHDDLVSADTALVGADTDDTNGRLITQVSDAHLVVVPMAAMTLLDEGVPARSVHITGDTAYDAALVIAGRRQPPTLVSIANPYSDGQAANRAAQAVAALLGLAAPPAPMPIPRFPAEAGAVTFGT